MPDLLALSEINKIPWVGSEGVLDFHNAKSLKITVVIKKINILI